MPRIKPTDTIDLIGHLDRNCHDFVAEYMYSKAQEKFYHNLPNEDTIYETVEIFYIHCAREYDVALEMQREAIEKNLHLAEFNERRNNWMCRDHATIRKRFIDVTMKLKELKNKENVAQNAMVLEVKEHNHLKKLIGEHKVELLGLQKFNKVIKKNLHRYLCYEQLLQDVVDHNPRYISVDDFITRTDALMLSSVEIERMNKILIQQVEAFRNELVSITREISSATLKMKNELDFFSRAYNKQYAEVLDLEENLKKAKLACINRELEKCIMIDGLYNLYTILCQRAKVSATDIKNSEVSKVCDFIKEEFNVLSGVLKLIEKRKQKPQQS